jgi:diguanylate cyclase
MRRALLLARRHENAFGVLMLDVDHFKRVNDDHGHEIGDRVLQSVASLLISHGRASDFYFRYGGEEFLAVLNEVTEADAMAVADKIRARVEAADISLAEGKTIRVTISIGVAMHNGHPDYRHLINRADEALYEAKRTGRNRVCLAP